VNRRGFLKAVGVCAMSVTLPGRVFGGDVRRKGRGPDIVVVIGDDMTWHDAGCYGSRDARTPNIDKLAAEGMRFKHCFTSTAMCAPTRQQMYTGLYPVKSGAYPNHSRVKAGTRSVAHYLKDLGYRVGIAGKKHYGPAESFPFENVSGKASDYEAIGEFINRDEGQPYFLLVTSEQPHFPWKKGRADEYDPAKLRVPEYMVDTAETREGLAKYYAEITYLDEQVGKCMELVKQSGREEDTLFIFTSEQGSIFAHCKWTLYDTGIRTAFVARWPGRVKAGSVTDAMVQYVDVTPTLVEAAGGKPFGGLDGSSFLAVLSGQKEEHRRFVYGVHTTRGIISGSECYPIRSIRDARFKYIINLNSKSEFRNIVTEKNNGGYWNSWVEKAKTDADAAKKVEKYMRRPAEELYDCEKDPYELNNLTDEPRYREMMNSFRRRLFSWMNEQGDKGIATEMLAFERQGREKSAGGGSKKRR